MQRGHKAKRSGVALFVLGLTLFQSLDAFATPPPTLSSELGGWPDIFVGRVVSSRDVSPSGAPFRYADGSLPNAVVVEVDEILKGRLSPGSRVEMFAAKGVASVPLLILGKVRRKGPSTSLRAYTALVDDEVHATVVGLVREFLAAGAIKDGEVRRKMMVEWVVRCVEAEPTRTDGISELAEGPWTVLKLGEPGKLSEAQCERLVKVLGAMPASAPLRDYLADQLGHQCGAPATPN
jgi:hypothetical protein